MLKFVKYCFSSLIVTQKKIIIKSILVKKCLCLLNSFNESVDKTYFLYYHVFVEQSITYFNNI